MPEAEEIHIRGRIDDAESAVDRERIDARLEVEALGENDLKDVAGSDVVLRFIDGFEECGLFCAGCEAEFSFGRAGRELWERLGEALFEAIEAAVGVGVSGLGLMAAEIGGDDEQNLLLDVVKGEDLVEKHEASVGKAEIVVGVDGQALDLADDIVGKEADGSSSEGREAGNAGGGVAVEGIAQESEDVACEFAGFAVLGEFNFAAVRDDAAAGANSDVGVAAKMFAAFDGFEEKALGFSGCEAEEGRNRRFEIGGKRAIERHERMRASEAKKLGAGGL